MKAKYFLLFVLLAPTSFVYSQNVKIESIKDKSVINYKLSHPLHEVEATSKDAFCILEVDTASKKIKAALVDVGVTTFDSGNSNRDSHAMEVVDAIHYPDAKFLSTSIKYKGDSLFVNGNLTFHGVTKSVTINALQKWNGDKLELDGAFDISLTEFKIKRPSLLLMPVNDDLKFNFQQYFNI